MPEEPTVPGLETTIHVRRALGGHPESLGWLAGRFSPLLLTQAEYRLGPKLRRLYDPEDLVAEVWAVALQRLPGLSERERGNTRILLRFLATTLLYKVNNLLQKHVLGKPEVAPLEPASSGGAPAASLPADSTSVVAGAIRREVQGQVRSVLAGLPDPDREIIVLRAIEQIPNDRAAAALGISADAASTRYHRALKRLREALPASIFEDLTDADST